MPRRNDLPDYKVSRKFSPELKNASQKESWHLWPDSDIMLLIGPAGCGKTFCGAALAMRHCIENQCENGIYLVRPAKEAAGENLGYLPGELGAKLGPFMIPAKEEIRKLVDTYQISNPPEIHYVPVAHARGRNLDDCCIFIDEAQNMSRAQFNLIFSRMCKGAKIVLTGDPLQTDIHDSFLEQAIDALKDIPRVRTITFDETENERHGLVPQVLRAFASVA